MIPPEAPVERRVTTVTHPTASEEALASTVRLARALGLLVALLAGVLFVLLLGIWVLGLVLRVSAVGPVGVAYCLLSAGVNYLIWKEAHGFEGLVAAREYGALRERLPVWVVLGLVFFVIEGLVLLFAYVKTDELLGAGANAPPNGSSAPPAAPPPGAM